jgi:hypothetical protein
MKRQGVSGNPFQRWAKVDAGSTAVVYSYKSHLTGTAMDLAAYEKETAVNRRAWQDLSEQVRREYSGQYVALGQGRVLAAAPTYDETVAAVERLQPVPECYWVFPADMEPAFEPYESL